MSSYSLKITLPNNVTSISSEVFYNCNSLLSITIPNGVRSIGFSAFYKCSSLSSVVLSNSLISISYSMFLGCKNLIDIIIPNSVSSISDSAFNGCSSLRNIIIPNSVTNIGMSAFSNCINLINLTIPFIGNAFKNPSNTHFGYIFGALSYSNNSSYIPTSLKTVTITCANSIGSFAFYDCNTIANIIIPNSVTSIGEAAFQNWNSSQTIYIQGYSFAPLSWENNWDNGCLAVITWES